MKLLLVESGLEGSIPATVREFLSNHDIDVQVINPEEAGRLTSFKSNEVQQLLSVLPRTLAQPPVELNRAQRRKLKRRKL